MFKRTTSKLLFLMLFVWLFLFSCKNESPKTINLHRNADSALLASISTTFEYAPAQMEGIQQQLNFMRTQIIPKDSYMKINEARFGEYIVRSFDFDSQQYPPFVVEITTLKNQFVAAFTFTDELYYLHNLNQNFSSFINLENNLNELTYVLGIQSDRQAIQDLIDVIFFKVLKLTSFTDKLVFEFTLDKVADSLVDVVQSEYRLFTNDESREVTRFHSKEGTFGFWKVWIEKEEATFCVRSKFFSAIRYEAVFM